MAPSWDYFAEDYGLEIAGVVEEGHGEEPSVGQFEELVKTVEAEKVSVIVVDSFVESRVVDSLAAETGAKIIRLNTLGSPTGEVQPTYVEMMLDDARVLSAALKSSSRS
jgi:ABC-type Zn uptake system ZnuABC Zn-binding protein ZnuA